MAKPYSDDFRLKVMQTIELDGLNKSEASQLFNISRNTINLWCQRKVETGDIKPKPKQGWQKRYRITDWENFRAFVKANGDKTQTQMVELWDGEISQRTMSRALLYIGHTRKKKHLATVNEMKPNEQPF